MWMRVDLVGTAATGDSADLSENRVNKKAGEILTHQMCRYMKKEFSMALGRSCSPSADVQDTYPKAKLCQETVLAFNSILGLACLYIRPNISKPQW